jgi:hypothetical protein
MSCRHVSMRGVVVLGLVVLTGCAPLKITQQRLISQANMTFSQSPVWNYSTRQLLQIETGQAFAGGGQGAGCTSCK